MDPIYEILCGIAGAEAVRTGELMKKHTTFRIGGPADYMVSPPSAEKAEEVMGFCRLNEIPCFVLGNGSNLLVSDDGFRGVVLRIRENMSRITVEGCTLKAEAGALLSAAAAECCAAGLSGMEFASGIPGTIGAGIAINAGAYGGELKQILKDALVIDCSGKKGRLTADDLEMGYRTSRALREGLIILDASFILAEGDPEDIRSCMEELNRRRREKQPLEYPSAGSTFKRPAGYFAGKLIQDAGLSGYRSGGACVSEKHCGFVVNTGGATAADVMAVIRHVQDEVFRRTGVELEPEVRILGEVS